MSPRFERVMVAALALALASTPLSAQAQQNPSPEERPPLKSMTDEQLRKYNFEWEEETAVSGSVVAGLVAGIPGAFIHGLGHFYLKDNETAWNLLTTEGVGLALLGAGLLTFATADSSEVLEELGIGVGQLGLVLIGVSYVADVVGSSRGSSDPLPRPQISDKLLRPTLAYRFVEPGDLPSLSLLEARLMVDLGVVSLEPYFTQDVLLSYRQGGLVMTLKPVQGRNTYNYLGLKAKFDSTDFTGGATFDFLEGEDAVTQFDLSLEMSLDLGQLVEHIRNVVNVVSIGVGFVGNGGERAALPGENSRAYFVLREAMVMNFSAFVGLEIFYLFDEGELVAPAGRGVGVVGSRIRLFPGGDLEIFVEGEMGAGVSFRTGLAWTGP
jgi:hypothetical protein